MNGRQVSYVFFFFTVAITVVAATKGYVSFWDTAVTLTCPDGDAIPVTWYKESTKLINETNQYLTLEDYTDKQGGLYHCIYSQEEVPSAHYFYVKAKVCPGCVEMDTLVAFAVVFSDVLFTLGIVLVVYVCAKRKAATTAPQRAQPRQARGPTRGPPTPDPDYQPLNLATRSSDVYAQAHRR